MDTTQIAVLAGITAALVIACAVYIGHTIGTSQARRAAAGDVADACRAAGYPLHVQIQLALAALKGPNAPTTLRTGLGNQDHR